MYIPVTMPSHALASHAQCKRENPCRPTAFSDLPVKKLKHSYPSALSNPTPPPWPRTTTNHPTLETMAKDKKPKTVDPRLVALAGSFLKDSGLISTAKIYEVEVAKRGLKTSKSVVGPASLAEALEAWDKAAAGGIEDEEDSGNESDSESSDSGEDTPDGADTESDDDGVKSDSSATVIGNDTEVVKLKADRVDESDVR
jgi:hypothetical protein